MRKLLTLLGLILLGIGLYQANDLTSYLERAIPISATVTSVETRPGPPKPKQNTPVHVKFVLPNGEERAAITSLPLMRSVKEGDSIQILVDPSNPQSIRLPLISELWARPLAYLISGLVLVCSVLVVKVRKGDFTPPVAS